MANRVVAIHLLPRTDGSHFVHVERVRWCAEQDPVVVFDEPRETVAARIHRGETFVAIAADGARVVLEAYDLHGAHYIRTAGAPPVDSLLVLDRY